MLTRITSGVIGVVALVAILVFMPQFVTSIAVAAVATLALYEFYRATIVKDNGFFTKLPVVIAGYVAGFLFMFADVDYLLAILAISVPVLLAIPVIFYKKVTFGDVAVALFGAVYIFALLRHVTMIHSGSEGRFMVFAIFIGAFITDTGAYFTGFFFGKHKLAPEISPKKTIEGSVGGILATVMIFLIYGYIGVYFFKLDVNLINLIIVAVVLSVVSQVGDLAASVIKRELGIKDYGNIMPGHGGALDRFDSVLFVAPVFYYMNLLLPVFVI